MTAIAALAFRGRVFLAGDAAVTDDDGALWILREPKVWVAAPGVLVGHAGNGHAFEALRWAVTWPTLRASTNLETWMHRDLVRALAPALAACSDESIIVAARGQLWTVDISATEDQPARLEFNSPADPFAAVGTGGAAARAALAALRGGRLTPRARILRALEIAAAQRSDVRGPFTVLEA